MRRPVAMCIEVFIRVGDIMAVIECGCLIVVLGGEDDRYR